MKQTFFVLKTLLLAGLASLVAIGDSIAQDNHLYIAMGTSVAAGFQPRPLCVLDPENPAITPPCDLLFDRPTDQSPADRLSQILAAEDGEQLELIKLGCGGETTTQMITGAGSLCYDETASQLDRALALLDEHGERVRLITIDIGVNDVIGCFDGSGGDLYIDQLCLFGRDGAVAQVIENLAEILGQLRLAATEDTLLIGMNYYNPFLAAYLLDPTNGPALADQSMQLVKFFNEEVLGLVYQAYEIPVADVAAAFQTENADPLFYPPLGGEVPTNVALACRLTHMCGLNRGVFDDIHATSVGYALIAAAFAETYRGGNAVPNLIDGDVDGDRQVLYTDLAAILGGLRAAVGDLRYTAARDLNNDGLVNRFDIRGFWRAYRNATR